MRLLACRPHPHPVRVQGLNRLILYGVDAYLSSPAQLLSLTALTGLRQLCVDVMDAAEPLVLSPHIMQVGARRRPCPEGPAGLLACSPARLHACTPPSGTATDVRCTMQWMDVCGSVARPCREGGAVT